ncbi:hypothetical protein AeMF1_019386, partial [Aphanomyces euteiches]
MLHVEMPVEGFKRNLRVLIDCGASKNFARRQTLEENASLYAEVDSGTSLTETVRVKLGDGSIVTAPKRSVRLLTQVGTFCSLEDYFVIDLDERWDLILGMGWLEKHQPCINWRAKTIHEVGPDFLKSHMGMESNEPIPSPAGDEQLATLRQLPATGKSTRQGGPMSSKEDIGRQAFNNTWVNTRRTGLPVYKSTAQRTGLQVSFASAPMDRVHGDVIVEEDASERNPIRQLPVSGRVFVEDVILSHCDLTELPKTAEEICKLEEMSFAEFRNLYTTYAEDPDVAGETPPAHSRVWDRLRSSPFYSLVKEYEDIFPEEVPARLPKDKGVRHEIDLTPDTKWCVTPQWPLPREQVEFIDSFFAAGKKAGHVRETISTWPVPATVTELRSWLGLATYLHKFSKNFADIATPLTRLLTKDVQWDWTQECQEAFDGIKASLTQAPILALPDFNRPFSVVCDASVRAIGCCLMQKDDEDRDRPISYQSRQLRAAERNYPVHDHELLAMKYALVKFRIYLLGSNPFTVYTDHASLRTAVNSPHLSDRMARWLAFFAEYNMTVEYKPGRTNVIADALSRRPSEEEPSSLLALSDVRSDLFDRIRGLYSLDPALSRTIDAITAGKSLSTKVVQIGRFTFHDDLLWCTVTPEDAPRVAVPCDPTLRAEIIREFHDTPSGGHFGRDKTYLSVARSFRWPRLYKAVARFVASCGVCQAVKAAPHSQAPLQSLDVPLELWESVSMDFIFGLPSDRAGNTGIFTLVDRASKYLIALPVKASITAEQSARLFFDNVYCHFGLPSSIVSDRDPRFTSHFWRALFALCGTTLNMSSSDHPESDGQTERANRVLEDILRSYALSRPTTWSSMLPTACFAYNTSVHASTGFTPFYA